MMTYKLLILYARAYYTMLICFYDGKGICHKEFVYQGYMWTFLFKRYEAFVEENCSNSKKGRRYDLRDIWKFLNGKGLYLWNKTNTIFCK